MKTTRPGMSTPLVPRRSWCLHPRLTIRLAALGLIVGGIFLYSRQSVHQRRIASPFNRGFGQEQLSGSPQRVSCHGPRGTLLSHSPDDELRYGHLSEICKMPGFSIRRNLPLRFSSFFSPSFFFSSFF